MSNASSTHPWEQGTWPVGTLYRLETEGGGFAYVVADGFDDAMRKYHHSEWANGLWPVVFDRPEEVGGQPQYDRVRAVSKVGPVVL